ncbi:unnamed protein product [Effrenium voratum]|nr:unnamed protein product [Effrenium voratum]
MARSAGETRVEDEYFAQFRADKEGPSTGIVYTPQQLSDHVAVSIFLRNVPKPAPVARSAATQRCQPHLGAKRITDFFARKDQDHAAQAASRGCLIAAPVTDVPQPCGTKQAARCKLQAAWGGCRCLCKARGSRGPLS